MYMGGKTPAYGGATPFGGAGSNTPYGGMSGGATPYSSGKTAAGGNAFSVRCAILGRYYTELCLTRLPLFHLIGLISHTLLCRRRRRIQRFFQDSICSRCWCIRRRRERLGRRSDSSISRSSRYLFRMGSFRVSCLQCKCLFLQQRVGNCFACTCKRRSSSLCLYGCWKGSCFKQRLGIDVASV